MVPPDPSASRPAPALSENSTVPTWIRSLVALSDDRFSVPGTKLRFGLDGVLGMLLPGLGDALGALVTLSLVFSAYRLGAPTALLVRMLGNVAADAIVGSIPLVGDLFDFGFKAGRRNLNLLEAYAQNPSSTGRASLVVVVLAALAALCIIALPIVLLIWLLTG